MTAAAPGRSTTRARTRGVGPGRALPVGSGRSLLGPGGAVLGHDQVGQLLHRRLRGRLVEGDRPVLEQVDPVADLEDLAVVVGDDDDRDVALGLEVAHQVEDQGALLGPHGRQRLVQQQDPGVAVDRAGDRDRLALAARELGHLVVDRGDVHPHVLQVLPGHPAHAAVAEQRPAHQLPVEEHVVVHAQLVDQGQVLVDGVDPERAGMVDRLEHDLLAVDEDAAGVGLVEAADDLDQGRLAGAVVADEAEHLAPAQAQVDVGQGGDPAEALGHVLDPEGLAVRGAGGHVRPARRSLDRYTLAIIETTIATPRIRK